MKSPVLVLMCFMATVLLATLALPDRLAEQEQTGEEHRAQHHYYKLVDLGTLGGPQSVVFGFLTQLLNHRGTVAGCADTLTADPNYPNFNSNFSGFSPSLPDALIFHTFRWQEGAVTDLGALPGINHSCPIWISENGMIAGLSENGAIDPVTGSPEVRATLWKDEEVIDLGTLGGSESLALAMNNRGQVVGPAANTIPDRFSLFGFPTQTRAFLWHKGIMNDLDTLGGPDAFASSINEGGQIAGCSYTNSTPNPTTGVPTLAPFLWKQGKMTNLGTLGGTSGCASLINNHGQVMGGSNLKGDQVTHGFFWDRGVFTDLGSFAGNVSPEWLDDAGEVVGNVSITDTMQHAFLWKNGQVTNLGTLPGDVGSNALGVNEGRVVGVSGDSNGNVRGFLWENGGPMIDLSTLIPPNSVLQPMVPFVINDRAEIAGTGFLLNGEAHAFLLIPCDDEHSDAEGCENAAAGATAARGRTSQSPKVAVSENVRQVLLHRLSFGRFVSSPQNLALSNTAVISRPNATLSPTSLTFPTQAIGTMSAPKIVMLKNTGTASLTISSIAITGTNAGDFAQTHTCGRSLAVGASCSIRVTFKPAASGTRTSALSLTDTAPGSPQKAPLSGTGTAGRCTTRGQQCPPQFPPCCPGLVCVPASTRAFCEPASENTSSTSSHWDQVNGDKLP